MSKKQAPAAISMEDALAELKSEFDQKRKAIEDQRRELDRQREAIRKEYQDRRHAIRKQYGMD